MKKIFLVFFLLCCSFLYAENPEITTDKIVFKYYNSTARQVKLLMSSDNYKAIYVFDKEKDGLWTLKLDYSQPKFQFSPGRYKYRLIVDNIYISDPLNSNTLTDPFVGKVSYFDLKQKLIAFKQNPQKIAPLTYRFYFRNTEGLTDVKEVMFVGSFNHFRPYEYFLKQVSKDLWYMDFKFEKAGVFYYQYVINGTWRRDYANPDLVYNQVGQAYSVLKVSR